MKITPVYEYFFRIRRYNIIRLYFIYHKYKIFSDAKSHPCAIIKRDSRQIFFRLQVSFSISIILSGIFISLIMWHMWHVISFSLLLRLNWPALDLNEFNFMKSLKSVTVYFTCYRVNCTTSTDAGIVDLAIPSVGLKLGQAVTHKKVSIINWITVLVVIRYVISF